MIEQILPYILIYIGVCFIVAILIQSKKEFKISVNNEGIEFSPLQEFVFILLISPFIPIFGIAFVVAVSVILFLFIVISVLAILFTLPLSIFGDSRKKVIKEDKNEEETQ